MKLLTIKEANSVFDQPLLYAQGMATNALTVVDDSTHRLYLKIESSSMDYSIDAPFIKVITGENLVYPVLKGNAAYGGDISPGVTKHLLLEFNCLGN